MRFLMVALLATAATAAAGDGWHIPHPHREGTPPPGKPRNIPHTHERAGYPQHLAPHTRPTMTPGVVGYYVGGGAPGGKGHAPCAQEGTWGWDDTGLPHFRRRVVLGWWHGRRAQGGFGAYKVDGPHVPDPIAGVNARIDAIHAGGEAEAEHP